MTKRKVYIYAQGACFKRSLDATKIQAYMSQNGHIIVNKPEKADVIILVTCAFLNGKTEFSLERIKEFKKYDAELIVAGCLPVVEREKLNEIFDGKIVGTKNIEEIDQLFPENKIKFRDITDANILHKDFEESKRLLKNIKGIDKVCSKISDYLIKHIAGENSLEYKLSQKQFHIRIAWGCLNNCSYCTIKKSTGPFHSKTFEKCMEEFREGLNQGYKSFVLDGTDIGAYGIDIESSFTKLLNEMTKIEGDYHIILRELHPKWIIKYINEFEEILKRNKILVMDVAIQSANARVLKLMVRSSDIEQMKDILLRVRKSSEKFLLTCEFIVGFPTETEEEFRQSLDFIKEVNFNGGQIYLFSCKKGTEAEKIEPKIPEEEMVRRIKTAEESLKNEEYKVNYYPKQRFLVFSKKL